MLASFWWRLTSVIINALNMLWYYFKFPIKTIHTPYKRANYSIHSIKVGFLSIIRPVNRFISRTNWPIFNPIPAVRDKRRGVYLRLMISHEYECFSFWYFIAIRRHPSGNLCDCGRFPREPVQKSKNAFGINQVHNKSDEMIYMGAAYVRFAAGFLPGLTFVIALWHATHKGEQFLLT